MHVCSEMLTSEKTFKKQNLEKIHNNNIVVVDLWERMKEGARPLARQRSPPPVVYRTPRLSTATSKREFSASPFGRVQL